VNHKGRGAYHGGGRVRWVGIESEAAVVVTVTLTVAPFVPLRVANWGKTAQVDAEGAPAQLSVTLLLKPPAGDTATE